MVNPAKVYVGGNLVLASGTLCVPKTAQIAIVPAPIDHNSLRLEIKFETNSTAQSGLRSSAQGNVVSVTLINSDSHAGIAFTEPVEIGWIGNQDRKLRLLATAQLIGQPLTALRVITYTITIDGGADV